MRRSFAEINTDYEKVLHSNLSGYKKTVKYAELMTEMERDYKVPLLNNEAWEKENKAVIALYRKLSISRTF